MLIIVECEQVVVDVADHNDQNLLSSNKIACLKQFSLHIRSGEVYGFTLILPFQANDNFHSWEPTA